MNEQQQVEIAALARQILAIVEAPPVTEPVVSPTGRQPRLLWTPALQVRLNRMRDEAAAGEQTVGAKMFRYIQDKARRDDYGDLGIWAAIMYQATGDRMWVDFAISDLSRLWASQLVDDNTNREATTRRVIMIDWLWPGLTDEQRQQCLDALDRAFTYSFRKTTTPAVNTTDSDQTIGIYFAVVCYGLAFGDIWPNAAAFAGRADVGGLVSTGRNRLTMRNCITDYMAMAKGGEFIESREYNKGTMRLVQLGYAAIRTATDQDYFPEVAEWAKDAAIVGPQMVTPDRKMGIQWGDEQNPHQYVIWMWMATSMCFDDPYARRHVMQLVEDRGLVDGIPDHGFLLFDPYGPVAATDVKKDIWVSEGQGIVTARKGESMLFAHFPPTFAHAPAVGPVDHNVRYGPGDFQFYRNGGFAITHPLSYINMDNGRQNNTMMHYGYGAPVEFKGAFEKQEFAGGLMLAGTCGGTLLSKDYYDPPMTFWQEWSRTLVWLWGEVDTLVIFDRSHVINPLATEMRSVRYKAADLQKITTSPKREWRLHTPVAATLSGQTAQWIAPNGETARATWSNPAIVAQNVDEAVEWAAINLKPTEKKWRVNLTLPGDPDFTTLIKVLQFGNPANFSPIVFGDGRVTVNGRTLSFWTEPGPRMVNVRNEIYAPENVGVLSTVRGGFTIS